MKQKYKNLSTSYGTSLVCLLKCCKNKNSYDRKIYFHSIKTNLYSIKYILIISPFFHDIKIYFHSVKINLYSVRKILIVYTFFHSSKIYFYYMNFSLNIFLVSIPGPAFVFKKVKILLSVCKLNKSTKM